MKDLSNKYKKGDVVRIKDYDRTMSEHGHNRQGEMDCHYGKKVKISSADFTGFSASGWFWKWKDVAEYEYPKGLLDPLPDDLFTI